MLSSEGLAGPNLPATDTLVLTYEARRKSRQHLRLASGEELAYTLPPGTSLRHGDKLLAADGNSRRVVEIVAAEESLLEVRANDALQFGRAAYHLGNRHVQVEISADAGGHYLRLQPDHVLGDMLRRQGCRVSAVKALFQPEGGAYSPPSPGHGADHHHPAETPGPKIHTFR
jgi:urease accessory protein